MFRLPKSVLSFGAVALVACGLTLAVPRTAHAVAAALVQVTNTSANPVLIQSVDAPGRNIYQSTCTTTTPDGLGRGFSCLLSAVPANQELVIQTVSISAVTPNPPAIGQIGTKGGGVVASMAFPVVNSGMTEFGTPFGSTTQPLTLYADPGTQPVCAITLASVPTVPEMVCTITGYLVTLP
jgi:hypothetical protein